MRLSSCSKASLTAFLITAGIGAAGAQSFSGFHAASVLPSRTVTLEPGQQVVVPVAVQIRSGFHVNSDRPADVYLIPTKLTWDNEVLELQDIEYPPAELVEYKHSDKPLSVYSGKFVIRSSFGVPAQIPDDLTELTGKLRYQACNDKACFPPKSLRVRIPVAGR